MALAQSSDKEWFQYILAGWIVWFFLVNLVRSSRFLGFLRTENSGSIASSRRNQHANLSYEILRISAGIDSSQNFESARNERVLPVILSMWIPSKGASALCRWDDSRSSKKTEALCLFSTLYKRYFGHSTARDRLRWFYGYQVSRRQTRKSFETWRLFEVSEYSSVLSAR